jgi:hypothetical protein
VAVLLLVALALFSSGKFVVQMAALAARSAGPDRVSHYLTRFVDLRPLLPRHGVVGYLSDRPDAVQEYYLAQYALAPLVVIQSPDPPVVIGNFFDPEAGTRLVAEGRFPVLKDFGEGLLLLGGRTRR